MRRLSEIILLFDDTSYICHRKPSSTCAYSSNITNHRIFMGDRRLIPRVLSASSIIMLGMASSTFDIIILIAAVISRLIEIC